MLLDKPLCYIQNMSSLLSAARKTDYVVAVVQRAWLTPVELFQPWYAQAVARYIVRDHQQRRPHHHLSIVEVGGGHGTMAAGILVRHSSHILHLPIPHCTMLSLGLLNEDTCYVYECTKYLKFSRRIREN